MKRVVRIGGRDCQVVFENHGSRIEGSLTWGEQQAQTLACGYVEVGPGLYSLLLDGKSLEARVTGSAGRWTVEIAGIRFDAEVFDPKEWAAATSSFGPRGRQSITSPMPGKVVRVLVDEGAMVEQGQGLVVVEAMKMQNELKAPKPGKVVALAARAGASVAAGEALVTLE
jgi:biotin carboxyl carrier protein